MAATTPSDPRSDPGRLSATAARHIHTTNEGELAMSSRDKTTVHDQPREPTSSTRLSGHGASRSNLQDKTPEENVVPAARIVDATAIDEELSTRRLNVMRFGYAFLGWDWRSSSGRFSSRTPHPSR
jgi:hypothetical protein